MEQKDSGAGSSNASSSSRSYAEDEDDCPICMDEMKNANKIVIPCGHEFCKKCIYRWLKQANGTRKCPLCNYQISGNYLKTIEAESKPKTANPRKKRSPKAKLPFNKYGGNEIRTGNGKVFINGVECKDGVYKQDGNTITIKNGVYTSVDGTGNTTRHGGRNCTSYSYTHSYSY